MKREEENKERERWQPGGGGKNKKCHLSGIEKGRAII